MFRLPSLAVWTCPAYGHATAGLAAFPRPAASSIFSLPHQGGPGLSRQKSTQTCRRLTCSEVSEALITNTLSRLYHANTPYHKVAFSLPAGDMWLSYTSGHTKIKVLHTQSTTRGRTTTNVSSYKGACLWSQPPLAMTSVRSWSAIAGHLIEWRANVMRLKKEMQWEAAQIKGSLKANKGIFWRAL